MNLRKEQQVDLKERLDQKWSKITHAVGFSLFFLISFPFIFYIATIQSSLWCVGGVVIFCLSVLGVYASSTLYHANYYSKSMMKYRKWDHYFIYLLIAGTNTPFVLANLDGITSISILTLFWSLVAIGIYLKAYHFHKVAWISLPLYLVMGWLGVLTIFFAYPMMSYHSIMWLLIGGATYTVGTIFYNAEYIKYNHTIWHLFVIGGTLAHYISIYYLFS